MRSRGEQELTGRTKAETKQGTEYEADKFNSAEIERDCKQVC